MSQSPKDLTPIWKTCFEEAQRLVTEVANNPALLKSCDELAARMADVYARGGTVFSCGNGGSHCDAMHFAEELTGRYRKNRRALGALALGDPSHTTCTANDFGYEHIFERQVEGLARKGDLLIGISTSGNSANVIKAFEMARSKGVTTVGLLGRGGGKLKELADLAIVVPGSTPERIQELHIKIIHTAIEATERRIFPELYA